MSINALATFPCCFTDGSLTVKPDGSGFKFESTVTDVSGDTARVSIFLTNDESLRLAGLLDRSFDRPGQSPVEDALIPIGEHRQDALEQRLAEVEDKVAAILRACDGY